MLPAVIRSLCIFVHAGLMWTVSKADASFCTKDQVTKCKSAAIDDALDTLTEGGICKPNKYVEYTHQCAVSSYIPTDFCCCAYEKQVFCCRYHYDGEYFRCDEDEDTIYSLTSEPLAIEILIPAIVVPSVALLCFIFYCIKCCCCNYDDDEDEKACDMSSCCRRKRRRRREKSAPLRTEDQYAVTPDNQRSILLPQTMKNNSMVSMNTGVPEKCDTLLDFKPTMDASGAQPSAPPYDVSGINPPPYNPDLYGSTALNPHLDYAPMPYINCQNENGHSVIYQPVITHTHIPLPVTKLTEHAPTVQDNDCSIETVKSTKLDER